MGLFSFFTKPSNQDEVINEDVEIKREDFVDDSDPNAMNLTTNQYSTGFPIDAIYEYIRKDYEVYGYEDALINSEDVYKEQRKEMIKNGLKRLFEQVSLRYKNDLLNIDVQVKIAEQQGLLNMKESLLARKETINEHISKIKDMEKSLDNNEEKMLDMIRSYERGFLKGLVAKSNTFLQNGNI